jgi:hypothetical protein
LLKVGIVCRFARASLADIEVAQALRRYAKDGELDAAEAAVALEDLRSRICSATPTSRYSIGCASFDTI